MKTQHKRMGWVGTIAGAAFVAGLLVGRSSAPKDISPQPREPMQTTSPPQTHTQPINRIAPIAARTEVDTSVKALNTEPTFTSLFDTVSDHDFEKMAIHAANSPNALDTEARLHILLVEWGKKDPFGALHFAQEMDRKDLLCDVLHQMGKTQPMDALRWIQDNDHTLRDRNHLMVAVYKGMAKVDPAGTVADIEQMLPGSMHDEMLSLAMDEWIQQDVNAVFNWLDTAAENQQTLTIYASAMGRFIELNPHQAANIIAKMEPNEYKNSFASQVACRLARQNIQSALDWAHGLNGATKNNAVASILNIWAASSDRVQALHYLLANPAIPGYRDLFSTAAIQLANNNPEALHAAMPTMTEADQVIAAAQLAGVYSRINVAQCDQWIESLAAGPVRDSAVKRLLDVYKQNNMPHAFNLSQTLSNEQERMQQMRQIMDIWEQLDPMAAQQALKTSPLISE